MKDIRRVVGIMVIVSFSIAALFGIAALLGGGSFGETEGRVLLTTLIVGVESIAILCFLAVTGHRYSFLGGIGAVVSLVAAALALYMTWSWNTGEGVVQAFGISLTLAASFAQVCLLLATAGKHRINVALWLTFVAVTIVAVMIVIPIAAMDEMDGGYWRIFGVVAILDVLGTVVLTAVGAFTSRAPATNPSSAPTTLLPASPLTQRITAMAAARKVSEDELLSQALDALEGATAREW